MRLIRFALSFALTGCFRQVIVDEQRVNDVAEQLEARPFEGSVEAVRERLRARLPVAASAVSTPIDELLTFDELDGRTWRFCFFPGTANCVEAVEATGRVHFQLHCIAVELCAERIWESLAPDEGRAADKIARDRMEERAVLFEQTFGGRWAVAGGLWGGLRSFENAVSLGARVGARRWVDPYLMGGALLEYERTLQVEARNTFALQLRFELSTWHVWSVQHWNLPEESGYVFVAPVLDLSDRLRGGFRAGLGVQIVRLAPVFVEAAVQSVFPRPETRMLFRIGIGV